jgi:hypothetical protein
MLKWADYRKPSFTPNWRPNSFGQNIMEICHKFCWVLINILICACSIKAIEPKYGKVDLQSLYM